MGESALVAQSCPTLCYSVDCSLPGSSARGILQARILEWVAMPFSRDLPNPGIKPTSPALAGFFTVEPWGKPMWNPNIKAINITKLVQIIFSTWFGHFEYVGYLPHGIPFIVLSYCLDLITINFKRSTDCGASSSKKFPAWNFTNHFWHIWSVTATSPYTA